MITQELKERALGAYLGFACGDALGATVEFMTPGQIQQRYGLHQDIIGGGWLALKVGQVTDDTQMSLALGAAILEQQGWQLATVAEHFLTWLDSDPPDIGNTCRRGLLRYRATGELCDPIRKDSAGNGACMRNLPVVLATLWQPENFRCWSLEQSHITHNNPLSDSATLCLGQMTQHLIQGHTLSETLLISAQLIAEHSEFNYPPYPGKSSAYIVDTVQTVLHAIENTDNFESCLIMTVNQGGDADTTGALAGMLAGAHYGVSHIPERWLAALDPNIAILIQQQTLELLQLADRFSINK